MVVGKLLSYWEGYFLGAMLNFGEVHLFCKDFPLAMSGCLWALLVYQDTVNLSRTQDLFSLGSSKHGKITQLDTSTLLIIESSEAQNHPPKLQPKNKVGNKAMHTSKVALPQQKHGSRNADLNQFNICGEILFIYDRRNKTRIISTAVTIIEMTNNSFTGRSVHVRFKFENQHWNLGHVDLKQDGVEPYNNHCQRYPQHTKPQQKYISIQWSPSQ